MANDKARELLAAQGMASVVEETVNHYSVRVKLAGLTHVMRLRFPVNWRATHIKFSRKQGFLLFTVPLLTFPIQISFSSERRDVQGTGDTIVLPSSWCCPICPPPRSMPRLDLAADWSTHLMSNSSGGSNLPELRGLFGLVFLNKRRKAVVDQTVSIGAAVAACSLM